MERSIEREFKKQHERHSSPRSRKSWSRAQLEYERTPGKEVEGIGTLLDPILFPSRSAARDSYLFSLRRVRLLEEGYGGGGGGGGKLRNRARGG